MSVVSAKLQEFLDLHRVCYETVPHVTDFTAQETSEHTHTPGHAFAKAVLVMVGDSVTMLVCPADHSVDLLELQRAWHSAPVRLAPESRITRIFSDCDRGAIHPFGNLYELPVYICPTLLEEETLTFNAGSHEMAIRISARDYMGLVHPRKLDFSTHV